MTSEVIDYNKVRASLNELHKTDLIKALAYDRHIATKEQQFTTGQRILIHQYIGQQIELPSLLAYQLLVKAQKAENTDIPKYLYNEFKYLTTKD
jgi:hypothetical protein